MRGRQGGGIEGRTVGIAKMRELVNELTVVSAHAGVGGFLGGCFCGGFGGFGCGGVVAEVMAGEGAGKGP